MALIKTRPTLRLLLARSLVAGEVGEFIVDLECSKPVPVDGVRLNLFGDLVYVHTSQYGRNRSASRFLDHSVELLDAATELAAGTHRLRKCIRLPENLPGSWEGDRLGIEYGVGVRVDIPWWPDARAEFMVRVAAAPAELEEGPPRVYVTHTGGPPAKGAYLEVSLGQQSVHPGGSLRASAALGNVDGNQYRKLIVALVALESIPLGLGGNFVNAHNVARWRVDVPEGVGELQPIPFKLQLPTNMVPGFRLHGSELSWLLQISADVAWSSDPSLRVPIEVRHRGPEGAADEGEAIVQPLAVGSDRLRLIWGAVAKATGLALVDDRLRGRGGADREIAIELHRSHDHDGPRVVGRLGFASLGVGLTRVQARKGLLSLERSDGLSARDAGQRAVLDARLGPLLAQAEAQDYTLTTADDEQLRFALDGAGLELEPLRVFVTFLQAVAAAIATLPAKLPAPAAVADLVEAWHRSAEALRAPLRLADLGLTLARDDIQVTIRCMFDDRELAGHEDAPLRATQIELRPGAPIPSRLQLSWTGDTALPEHDWPLAELTAAPSWAAGRVGLTITGDRVRLYLPAPLPDPRLELDRIEQLFAIGRRLRGEQGPYR